MSATEAAKAAGYPRGKSEKTFAANARGRAGAKRVKAMVVELQKPVKEKIQQQITANIEWATQFAGRHLAYARQGTCKTSCDAH